MSREQITQLLQQYLKGTLTPAEEVQLNIVLKEDNGEVFREVIEKLLAENKEGPEWTDSRLDRMVQSILNADKTGYPVLVPRRSSVIRKISWTRVAASAVIILILSVGGYFYFDKNDDKQIAKTKSQSVRFKNDVAAPGKAKAMITLSDGSIIALDSVTNGILAKQGNVDVTKTADGKIVYSGTVNTISFNTLTNPKGSKVIDITLADGSRVWLNAGSSVTYPVSFVEKDRKVKMTGEAYFEIRHDAVKKFLVEANGVTTEVLGTHFNVNAYDDEATIKTTLLEGSVKVIKGEKGIVIKPRQQAVILKAKDDINVMDNVDVEETIAWVNGRFQFKSSNIETLMRQLERWYDVKVVYDGAVTKKFTGKMPRTMSMINVFKALEETGGVSFSIDGKKITVRP